MNAATLKGNETNVQPCGHPTSLRLMSAETGEPLYCEACDDKSGRSDAEAREMELAATNQSLRLQRDELLTALTQLYNATKGVSTGAYDEEAHDIAVGKAGAVINKFKATGGAA